MGPMMITASRRALTAVWALVVVGLIGLAGWSHLASLIVITGGSMAPAIPAGAVIEPAVVSADDVVAGDILTVRADNGVIVTHRVSRVVDLPEGRFFELKGDANLTVDPELVPTRSLIGRVDGSVPFAGYVLGLLSTPSGLVFVLAALGMLLVCIWLLEDADQGSPSGTRRDASAKAAHGTPA
ncbi:MAG TPA: signal peptidase I [Candidatus Limnocylindrales bacterium]|nr:signal peptidase I [Candidatus Limnocylindrales bacterium]